MSTACRFLADAVLLLHFAYFLTVVLGLVVIVAGLTKGKRWAKNLGLRLGHLAMIGFVVAQAWAGIVCPLTRLESELRRRAGQEPYPLDFLEYWVHRVMFLSLPPWAFVAAYTAFAAAVVATFVLGPPTWPRLKPAVRP